MWLALIIASGTFSQLAEPDRAVAVIPVNGSELGKQLEAHVSGSLRAAMVPLTPVTSLREQEAAQCETNRLCFALLGRLLGTFAVVRVEAAVIGSDVAVLVEAIESASAEVIREESFVIAISSIDADLPERLKPLAGTLLAALSQAKPIVLVTDTPAPPVEKPAPPVENPALNLTTPPAQPRRSVPIWVTGSGAIVFAGASAGLLAVGASARTCLHGAQLDGSPTVCVPQSQVAVVQQRADLGLITGTTAAAVAVGLAVTAIVQYVTSKN